MTHLIKIINNLRVTRSRDKEVITEYVIKYGVIHDG